MDVYRSPDAAWNLAPEYQAPPPTADEVAAYFRAIAGGVSDER